MLDPCKRYLSCNMPSEIIRACLVLSESDSNKPHLRSSNLLRLTVQAMKLYAHNAPRLTVTRSSGVPADFGGGGSDVESAQLSVELLLQLSFCYPIEMEWRSAVAQHCQDAIEVLRALKNLPADRQLDTHSVLSLNHLIGTLGIAPQSPVQGGSRPSSTAAPTNKHVMLSYCWGAKKELVVELGASLRAKGVDVWRDEEGSQCVPAMSGSTDDCMAAAIERSHTIIVCVSRAYKASANCRMEAKYANDMHKRGKVNLVFAMMEQDYTTRSSPEYAPTFLQYKIDTVTVVTGIDKRINLSNLCDAAPDVFGVRSQGIRLLTVYGQFLFDSQQVSSPRLLRQRLQAASEMDATFLYPSISAMMAMLLLALYTQTEKFK